MTLRRNNPEEIPPTSDPFGRLALPSLSPEVQEQFSRWGEQIHAQINPQLTFDGVALGRRRSFLSATVGSDIPATQWFDKLDCSVSMRREPDPGMTLAAFLRAMNRGTYMTLILRRPYGTAEPAQVELCADTVHPSKPRAVHRFIWWRSAATSATYSRVADIYQETIGRGLSADLDDRRAQIVQSSTRKKS